jgi:hypothetical protein
VLTLFEKTQVVLKAGFSTIEGIGPTTIIGSQFSHQDRKEYFDSVRAMLPENSLIFFDPDTGLKGRGATEKHLTYSELKDFLTIMDGKSILMVYQHFYRDRTKHRDFPAAVASRVTDETGETPVYINDNTIVFLFLVRSPGLKEKLQRALDRYRKKYKGSFKK